MNSKKLPHEVETFKIGKLAEEAGVGHGTIYYYESIKLLLPYKRKGAGNRYYNQNSLEKLKTIKILQNCGYSMNDIKKITKFYSEAKEKNALSQAEKVREQIEEIVRKIEGLENVKENLDKRLKAISKLTDS